MIIRLYCGNIFHVHVSDVAMIELLCQWKLSHNSCALNTHSEIISLNKYTVIKLQSCTYI